MKEKENWFQTQTQLFLSLKNETTKFVVKNKSKYRTKKGFGKFQVLKNDNETTNFVVSLFKKMWEMFSLIEFQ